MKLTVGVVDVRHIGVSRSVGGVTETVKRDRHIVAKSRENRALDRTGNRTDKAWLRITNISLYNAERDVVEGHHARLGRAELLKVLGLGFVLLDVRVHVEVRRSAVPVVHVYHVARSAAIIRTSMGTVDRLVDGTGRREQTYGASAIDGALELRPVVGVRELDLNTSLANVLNDPGLFLGDEEARAAVWGLLHDR